MSTRGPAASAHADRAYGVLRDLIIRGRLAPGARAPEVELATRLGISRTPVREALRRLAHEGFLTAPTDSRRQRFVVAALTVGDLRDLYGIMSALEGAAGRNVARLSAAQRRTLAVGLRSVQATFEAVARRRPIDLDRIFDAHNAFHETFVEACATPRLKRLIEQVRPQVDRYEFIYAPHVGPSYDETFAEHKTIARAVRDGSAAAADAAIRANWLNGATRLERAIEQAGPRGDYDAVVISVHEPERYPEATDFSNEATKRTKANGGNPHRHSHVRPSRGHHRAEKTTEEAAATASPPTRAQRGLTGTRAGRYKQPTR